MGDQTKLNTSGREGPLLSHGSPYHRFGRRRLSLTGVAIVLLAVGAIAAWRYLSQPAPVHYVSAPLSRGAVTQVATATGTVNPILTIIVGSYVSGVIQSVSCDYNTVVKAGQICAKVDPRPYQAKVNQYSGQLLRDRAILNKDQANLARYRKLAAQNSIARQQAEDQAYLVQQDEGTVKLDEGLVEGARLNLEYTNIKSPVDGTVVSRNVTQGQTVAASFQTPTLFLIATDLKKMQVDTNISESDIGGITKGDEATFTVDAYPNRVFHGAVAQVRLSPQTIQNVVTYDVVISVDNADLALMPGMTASAQIIIDRKKNVLRVPDQALRFVPGGLTAGKPDRLPTAQPHVWVLRNRQLVAVPVVPGLDDGNYTEIVKGAFQPGDQIITGEVRGSPSGTSGLRLPRL